MSKKSHPFTFVILNFNRLLELKYKMKIDLKKFVTVPQVVHSLKTDYQIFN